MVDWVMALYALAFVIIVALTRYVSLGTICATLLVAVISFIPVFGNTLYFIYLHSNGVYGYFQAYGKYTKAAFRNRK